MNCLYHFETLSRVDRVHQEVAVDSNGVLWREEGVLVLPSVS